jgi:hypothetical protein
MSKIWFHKSKNICRWWLHWGRTCWSYEGYLFKNARHNSIGFDLGGDENDIMVHLGIKGFFNFYFGVEKLLPRKLMNKLLYPRHYGISLFEEYISIEFHRDDFGYSDGWKGYHKMIDWKTILFGKLKYECREAGRYLNHVEMPEGNYPCEIIHYEATWTRPRLLRPIEANRFEVIPDIPIPEPGKGENSWDIGDDALHSITVTADSIKEALKITADSVIQTRIKRAGENWVPDKGFPVPQFTLLKRGE